MRLSERVTQFAWLCNAESEQSGATRAQIVAAAPAKLNSTESLWILDSFFQIGRSAKTRVNPGAVSQPRSLTSLCHTLSKGRRHLFPAVKYKLRFPTSSDPLQ